MSTESTDIHLAAFSLPDEERADLAYRLLQTLKPKGVWSEDSLEFQKELERRIHAFEAGETSAEDWETVSARLRQALQDRKSK